ncbi:MAG: 2-hydroxyacyl-CoA dehydratase [Oscillospiraceae bacterium]|nr:2-hydroxyacyl-CoA dehydratase [Oscillospiraceae bacterium]
MLDVFRASDPAALKEKYLAEGKKVVLTAPVYTPEEIVHSMGLVPMGVWGADTLLERSKRYFPAFICSIVQSIVELGMRGTYEGASAIVIPSLCDSLKVLGQNWKYAVPSIPFIPMTYPQNRANAAGRAFAKAGYLRVIRDLEAATGAKFSTDALAASLKTYNEHNAVMRRFAREAGKYLSAADRSAVFKSAFFMLKEEHTALVKELLAALEGTEPASGPSVVTTGILADSPALLGKLDALGLRIAADDVAAESRQYRTDAPETGDPLEALAAKFAAMGDCSVLLDPEKHRAAMLVETVRETGASGLLALLTKFCDPEEFDLVIIKKACAEAGIPFLAVELDRQMVNFGQAETMLEAFRERLG